MLKSICLWFKITISLKSFKFLTFLLVFLFFETSAMCIFMFHKHRSLCVIKIFLEQLITVVAQNKLKYWSLVLKFNSIFFIVSSNIFYLITYLYYFTKNYSFGHIIFILLSIWSFAIFLMIEKIFSKLLDLLQIYLLNYT